MSEACTKEKDPRLKSGTRRFTFEYQRAGQPRPYADHIYEFTVTVEWVPYKDGGGIWEPNDGLNEAIVIRHARAFQPWHDKPEWHQPRLKSKRKIGPGVWQFIVTEPYLD